MISPLTFIFATVFPAAAYFLYRIFSYFYPVIHTSFYSRYPEAETQIYAIGLLTYLLFITFVLLTAYLKPFRHLLTRTIVVPRVFDVLWMLIAGVSSIASFYLFKIYILPETVTYDSELTLGYGQIPYFIPMILVWACVICLGLIFLSNQNKKSLTLYKVPVIAGIILIIIIMTFQFGDMKLALYDYTHYIGPVHDIIMGQPPLASPSFYGFLSTVFLSMVFRILPETYLNWQLFFAVFHTLSFIVLFYFILRLFQSISWAAIATITAIIANFSVAYWMPNSFPQSTLFRFGAWILPALVMTIKPNFVFKKIWRYVPSFLVICVFLWTSDTGLYTLGAYISWEWFRNLGGSIRTTLKRFGQSLISLGLSLITILIVAEAVFRLLYGVSPNWRNYFFGSDSMIRSYYAYAFPDYILFFIFLSIPILTFSYLMSRKLRGLMFTETQNTVLFLALYALFSFIYMGFRSVPSNMRTLAIPVIICLWYMIRIWIRASRSRGPVTGISTVILISVLLSFWLYYDTHQALENFKKQNITNSISVIRNKKDIASEIFKFRSDAIWRKYGSEIQKSGFYVLSPWDSYYIMYLGTVNRIGINCLLCHVTNDTLGVYADKIKIVKPQLLFVEERKYEFNGRVQYIWDQISEYYLLTDKIDNIEVYRRKS